MADVQSCLELGRLSSVLSSIIRAVRHRGYDLGLAVVGFALAAAHVAQAQCGDPCPPECRADLDESGSVDASDLSLLLGAWGSCPGCVADIDDSGTVDAADLSFTLSVWGGICEPLPWATVLEENPDPAVVTNESLRAAILATGLPWRVRDNGTNIEMLLVPPGSFDMGCIQGSEKLPCYSPEQPVHTVTLTSAYYIGRYEVTQAEWQARMGNNPSYFLGNAQRPVERVSWTTIQGFLGATGLRLPTEAEWEFACRAGTITPFHSGPGFPNGTTDDNLVGQIAWWFDNSGNQTHAVGGKGANALGLHDMLGNVWEWCGDWYALYTSAPQTNPTGPATGSYRVIRGGSWGDYTSGVRSSARSIYLPVGTDDYVGFRVARAPL